MEKCIIITTLSNNLEIIKKIQNELLQNNLVAGCQVSNVDSTYWWEDKINEQKEYCLQMRTVERLYKNVESIIKENHNYEVPEISYYEIKGSKEIIDWINKYANNK